MDVSYGMRASKRSAAHGDAPLDMSKVMTMVMASQHKLLETALSKDATLQLSHQPAGPLQLLD